MKIYFTFCHSICGQCSCFYFCIGCVCLWQHTNTVNDIVHCFVVVGANIAWSRKVPTCLTHDFFLYKLFFKNKYFKHCDVSVYLPSVESGIFLQIPCQVHVMWSGWLASPQILVWLIETSLLNKKKRNHMMTIWFGIKDKSLPLIAYNFWYLPHSVILFTIAWFKTGKSVHHRY